MFESWESLPLQSVDFRTIREMTGFLGKLPVPVPHDFIVGIDAQRAIMETPHPTFLDGQWSLTGFPSYFLRAVCLQVSVGIAGALATRSGRFDPSISSVGCRHCGLLFDSHNHPRRNRQPEFHAIGRALHHAGTPTVGFLCRWKSDRDVCAGTKPLVH